MTPHTVPPQIQCYCVNECRSAQTSQTASGTFELILAPQRKKLIQQYALSGDKMVHLKDYPLPDTAVTMVTLIAATYCLVFTLCVYNV